MATKGKNGVYVVSDHAVLRYCERYLSVPVEQVRETLLQEPVKAAMRAGAKSVTVDGITYKIKGTTVVTVT